MNLARRSRRYVVHGEARASIGTIAVPGFQGVTNAAFGGPDHRTLYITGLGNDKGLFKLELDIPGRPY